LAELFKSCSGFIFAGGHVVLLVFLERGSVSLRSFPCGLGRLREARGDSRHVFERVFEMESK
jgi:hypothetical protein